MLACFWLRQRTGSRLSFEPLTGILWECKVEGPRNTGGLQASENSRSAISKAQRPGLLAVVLLQNSQLRSWKKTIHEAQMLMILACFLTAVVASVEVVRLLKTGTTWGA